MNKKKILWQAHEGNVSGANIALLEYMDALENQFDFWVILPHEGSMIQALEERSIPFSVIHQYGWTNSFPNWKLLKWIKVIYRSFIAIRHTKRLIRNFSASIVSTNTLVPFTASVAARQLGVPHIWWIHEFGKEDFGFTIGWGNEKWAWKWMQVSSRLIIGNSKAISSKFSNLMPKVMIETIYQPVSWQKSDTKVSVKKARFLMFGQLIESKGHKDVIEAINSCKETGKQLPTLHILGPCENQEYYKELNELVQRYQLQNCIEIEIGYFNKNNVMPHYEVLIVASQSEAFGRVIVEANRLGLRTLVRNSGGAPELINETNGLLFNNQLELIEAISGDKLFPDSIIQMNYNETIELEKTTALLNSL